MRFRRSRLENARVGDYDLPAGFPRIASDPLDFLDDVHAGCDAPEDDVLAVQPRGLGRAEEELASVGVGAGVGHGEDAGSDVLLDEILVGELVAVDGLAAGAVAAGEVASLAHEAGDDAVEGGALIAEPLFPGAEGAEVLRRLRANVGVQRHHDPAGRLTVQRHVEKNFRLRHCCCCCCWFGVVVTARMRVFLIFGCKCLWLEKEILKE